MVYDNSVKPDAYSVFVINMHTAYSEEQLQLGFDRSQILDLADYSTKYSTWLLEQYKESTNGR